MGLTREQRAAVERMGQDVCIVAGPGSGKTRVLTERFRWRVSQGVPPLRLLAITFTEKAANELKQRVTAEFAGEAALRAQIERAPIATIDAFCASLLREHAIEAGLDPEFTVLDAADAYAELWEAAEQALDELLAEDPEGVRDLLSALDLPDAVQALVSVHQAMRITATGAREGASARLKEGSAAFRALCDALRRIAAASPHEGSESQRAALESVQVWARRTLATENVEPSREHFRVLNEFDCNLNRLKRGSGAYEEIKAVKGALLDSARQALVGEYYAAQRALLWKAIERVDETYRQRKLALNAVDFADLEEHAIRLLRDNEPLRQRVRGSYDEILMDELQDTNPLQASLLDLVRRPDRFFAVGDINQSVYGFRHAEPETFRKFRDALASAGKTVDRLGKNFRSRAEILYAAETVLGGADGIESQRLEACRAFAAAKDGPPVEVIAALGETSEAAAEFEARAVARRIRELEGTLDIQEKESRGVRPARLSDMVILVRGVNALPVFEQALYRAGIPYLIGRGKHFYEAREVTDLVHLLHVIVNARDEVSLAAVLRSPLVGIGNETLFRLKEAGNLGSALNRLIHLDTSAFDAEDLARLHRFRDLLLDLRAFADDVSPDRLLSRAIDASGYEAQLGPRERNNVAKLLGRVRDWFERRPRPLLDLVYEFEFLRASDPDEPSAPPDDSANAVRMLTVHAAKGLEFPIVFIAAMHKGVASDSPPLAFSPAAGLVARWLDPSSHEPVKDIAYTVFSQELKRKQADEENRLLYVAMTRAEERLVLSLAHTGKAAPRNWAGRVATSLGLELAEGAGEVSIVREQGIEDGRGFDLRLWRAGETTAFLPATPPLASPDGNGIARLARPERTGQHDSYATVSSIGVFDTCPRRYYLARYLGWQTDYARARFRDREVDDDSIDAGEFGREVHELLADQSVPNASPAALELAARFRTSDLGRRASGAARVEREFDFVMAIEDLVVQGRIDLWFEDAGELFLVDYKTDAVSADEAEERAGEYALQMTLYALALEKCIGRRPDAAYLHFLRPDLVIGVALDAAGIEAAVETVRDFARAQQEMAFPFRPGEACLRCTFYRGMCPARLA